MKSLQNNLWDAYEELCDVTSGLDVLNALIQYLGDDTMRRFVEDIISEWDLEDYFNEYEEFADED